MSSPADSHDQAERSSGAAADTGHDVDLSGRGEVPQPVMQAFFEAVKQLARLPVQDGEVSFEIELTVSR